MARCVNENCDKDPLKSMNAIVVTCDGDFACSEHCKKEYEKQRDYFFSVTCHSEEATKKWLMGD